MFNRSKYIFFLLIIFSIASCSPMVENNADSGKIRDQITENNASISESNKIDFFDLEDACIEISASSTSQPNWKIALQDEITNKVILFDLSTNKKIELDKAKKGLAISPDNILLAFSEDETGDIVIIDSDGNERYRISVPTNWIGVINWISQNEILINDFPDQSYQLASTVVLDIDNDRNKTYESNYHNITHSLPLLQGGNNRYTRSVYNNQLTQVLYFGEEEDILWDLNENKEISRYYSIEGVYRGGLPQWTNSGEYLYIGMSPQYSDENDNEEIYQEANEPYYGGYEIYRVDNMGDVKRITYFTTEFMSGEEAFSLSSSENMIAFWLNKNYNIMDNNPKRELTIFDLDTRKATNYCIQSSSEPYQPEWSPDDRYLALTRYLPNTSTLSDVVLLDMDNNSATVICENAVVIGWMTE